MDRTPNATVYPCPVLFSLLPLATAGSLDRAELLLAGRATVREGYGTRPGLELGVHAERDWLAAEFAIGSELPVPIKSLPGERTMQESVFLVRLGPDLPSPQSVLLRPWVSVGLAHRRFQQRELSTSTATGFIAIDGVFTWNSTAFVAAGLRLDAVANVLVVGEREQHQSPLGAGLRLGWYFGSNDRR